MHEGHRETGRVAVAERRVLTLVVEQVLVTAPSAAVGAALRVQRVRVGRAVKDLEGHLESAVRLNTGRPKDPER